MKTLLVAAVVGLTAVGALAQGQFNFGNRVTAAGIEAPITDASGALITFDNFNIQAYVGLSADSLAPVGAVLPVHDTRPGFFRSVATTTTFAGGTQIFAAVAAWSKGFDTYDAAKAGGGQFGMSAAVPITVAVAPELPKDMVGLAGFQLSTEVIPEPSTDRKSVV